MVRESKFGFGFWEACKVSCFWKFGFCFLANPLDRKREICCTFCRHRSCRVQNEARGLGRGGPAQDTGESPAAWAANRKGSVELVGFSLVHFAWMLGL